MNPYLGASLAALRIALSTGNLSCLLLLTNPRGLHRYLTESAFLFSAFNGRRGLTERNVFEVLNGPSDLDIRLANLVPGGTWFERSAPLSQDIVNLCLLTRLLMPGRVFEIGTLNGYTALHFALNSGDDTCVYTLDLPRGIAPSMFVSPVDLEYVAIHRDLPKYCFEGSPAEAKIQTLEGDSANFDFSPYENSIDLFFVDGAHSYDYVRSDSLNALRCTRPGGVIAWHDFGRAGTNGVRKLLLELAKERAIYCVPGGSLAFCVV